MRGAGGDELTFFEQVTAVAMVAIADAAVDVTVLEVGLGGRLDATNVVDPTVAVVTGVALDHEAIIGGTRFVGLAMAREALRRGHQVDVFHRGGKPVIGLDGASTQHARLAPHGDVIVLEDLGSTNGTYLNEEPLRGPQPLHPGDKIRIGDSVFVFER